MSFIAKSEKVRFVTLGKREGQGRDVGFCYSNSSPWFSNENGVLITRAATLVPEAQFLVRSSPSQESVEMCLTFTDVAAPCRAPVSLAPYYVPISSAIRKDPQSLAKKFLNLPWLPTLFP